MNISFSPVDMPGVLTISRSGDALTVNSVVYDFSPLGEGDVLPRDAVGLDMLRSDVTRIGGVVYLTLRLPLGETASLFARFPEPVSAPNGVVEVPT